MLRVRRTASATPLARAHDSSSPTGSQRSRRRIPWERFSTTAYSPRALALAFDQAKTLAEGEYGAVGLFGQLASALALTRAPFDIISAAASISSDEIRHADYCTRFAELCSGHDVELEVDGNEVLRASRNLDDIEELDHFVLKYSAIGETLAGALLTECRRNADDPVARALYTALAADEVHHARLGWYYFAWRAPAWTLPEKQRLADRISTFVMDLECYFWTGRDAPLEAEADAKALGVLDSLSQRGVIQRVMQHEICPGLDAIGLNGSTIWEKRRRATRSSSIEPARLVLTATTVSEFDAARERAIQRGAEWLARAIGDDGSLRLTLDAAGAGAESRGQFYYGRAAVVLLALNKVATAHPSTERLRQFLMQQVALVAAGRPPADWPAQRDAALGTVALLRLAGVEHSLMALPADVAAFSQDPASTWHLAQVVTAAGAEAGPEAWTLCRASLRTTPWPCWTALAARRLDDQTTLAQAVRNLQTALAPLGRAGECHGPTLPLALVAAAVEALAPETAPEASARVSAGRSYLMRWQIDDDTPDVDPELSLGAFPLEPNHTTLRADVTAHALLALAGPP
ncbi:MAG TPA: ferritin-like domain-containing protein [Polyangiaceae bacterium]